MHKLVKIILTTCFCLGLAAPVWADQQTTVLTQKATIGEASLSLPYIDGNMAVDFEKMANNIIVSKSKEMLRRLGNKGELDYSVALNRPSVVSVLLKASYDGKTIYEAVNLDLTCGKEFSVDEFFVNDDKIIGLFGKTPDVLFGEKGIYKRPDKVSDYNDFVPYSAILPFMRIGEAGRLLQIVRLTQNADGKEVHMKAGQMFALKLDSNPSTGYSWRMKPVEAQKGSIAKAGSSFVMPAATDNRVGTPGTEIIMYAVGKPGTYDICMEYKRPWEMFVSKTVKFKVVAE